MSWEPFKMFEALIENSPPFGRAILDRRRPGEIEKDPVSEEENLLQDRHVVRLRR